MITSRGIWCFCAGLALAFMVIGIGIRNQELFKFIMMACLGWCSFSVASCIYDMVDYFLGGGRK